MIRRTLTVLGAFSLFALVAGSVAALVLVKQRVHVTIASDAASDARARDPVAELQADVADLRRDVATLARTLEEALAALDERGAAKAPAAGKRFLRFDLPSNRPLFEGRQALTLVPSLSRVGFDAKSTLHDFTGVTSRVEGALEVELGRPERSPSGRIEVEAASLDTGVEGRDEEMRSVLAVKEQPKIVFAWTAFEPKTVDAAGQRIEGIARGDLTIRGRTRPVALAAKVTVDASRRVAIDGELRVRMSDFGVAPPRQLGVISVEDEVRIWVALRARALPVAEGGREK